MTSSSAAGDGHHLERFVVAQEQGAVYEQARRELEAGRKSSHWMWFVFPQIAGLGQSPTSRHFAIGSLEEAVAYLAHPVLGRRLRECSAILAATEGRTAEQILGPIDAQKLRSSMTLFHRAAPGEDVFTDVLDRYFPDGADPSTDRLLGRA